MSLFNLFVIIFDCFLSFFLESRMSSDYNKNFQIFELSNAHSPTDSDENVLWDDSGPGSSGQHITNNSASNIIVNNNRSQCTACFNFKYYNTVNLTNGLTEAELINCCFTSNDLHALCSLNNHRCDVLDEDYTDIYNYWTCVDNCGIVNRSHRTTSIHRNALLKKSNEFCSQTLPKTLENRRKWMSPAGVFI